MRKPLRRCGKALEDTFERKNVASRIFLKKRLASMTCEAGESLAVYFRKFQVAVRKLKSAAGGKMNDDNVVMQLLISLPDAYDHAVSALKKLSETEVTLKKVKSRLLEGELKKKFKKPEVLLNLSKVLHLISRSVS